jgi:hypothetical protein
VRDATIQSEVDRLMANNVADLIFIEPPCNVDYEGYTGDRLKIAGDRMSDAQFKRFLEPAFASCRGAVKPAPHSTFAVFAVTPGQQRCRGRHRSCGSQAFVRSTNVYLTTGPAGPLPRTVI